MLRRVGGDRVDRCLQLALPEGGGRQGPYRHGGSCAAPHDAPPTAGEPVRVGCRCEQQRAARCTRAHLTIAEMDPVQNGKEWEDFARTPPNRLAEFLVALPPSAGHVARAASGDHASRAQDHASSELQWV